MKLLLTSNGLANDAIVTALADLASQPFAEMSVAFVPTASTFQEEDKSWLIDDLHRFRMQGFASIDIVDLAAVPADSVRRRLEAADIIAFGGGNTYQLLEWIERCASREYVASLFDERIYVGISAGSLASNPHPALTSESSLWGEIGGVQDPWVPGLNLVDFYTRPHLKSPDFPCSQPAVLEQVADRVPARFYAIDDDSALKVVDGDVEIVGTGAVLLFNDWC